MFYVVLFSPDREITRSGIVCRSLEAAKEWAGKSDKVIETLNGEKVLEAYVLLREAILETPPPRHLEFEAMKNNWEKTQAWKIKILQNQFDALIKEEGSKVLV